MILAVALWVLIAALIAVDLVRVYRRSVASIKQGTAITAAIEAERDADRRVLRALGRGDV